jgi:hypothetical protein
MAGTGPQSSGVHLTVAEQSNPHEQTWLASWTHTRAAADPSGQVFAIWGETPQSSGTQLVCKTVPHMKPYPHVPSEPNSQVGSARDPSGQIVANAGTAHNDGSHVLSPSAPRSQTGFATDPSAQIVAMAEISSGHSDGSQKAGALPTQVETGQSPDALGSQPGEKATRQSGRTSQESLSSPPHGYGAAQPSSVHRTHPEGAVCPSAYSAVSPVFKLTYRVPALLKSSVDPEQPAKATRETAAATARKEKGFTV